MSIVGKITTLDTSSAPITQTLFGRCTTAADVRDKEIEFVNNSFNMGIPFEEGFSLRVFFENGNIAKDPRLQFRRDNDSIVTKVLSFAMYQGGNHEWEPESLNYHNYYTCNWTPGGIVSFTYITGKFIIDNQALNTNDFYGYINSSTYFVDWAYGIYTNRYSLQTCGYQNPKIKNGHYIYAMAKDNNNLPIREPSTQGIQGVLKVINAEKCVIEEWTFFTEPGNIYRRIWSETNNAWSEWKLISGIALGS